MEKPCKVKFKKHLLLYCIEIIVSFQTKYSFIIICAIFMYLFRKVLISKHVVKSFPMRTNNVHFAVCFP